VSDEHAVTIEIEADTAPEAMTMMIDMENEELQAESDYHLVADDYEHDFRHCEVDGQPVGDGFVNSEV
jgi:hypothetical protein